jgi:hypothetical protein
MAQQAMAQQAMAQQTMAGRANVASRTVGVPGDPSDVGNWGYWVGTVSLFVEAALIVLSAGMLLALRQRPPAAAPSGA